MTPDLVHTICQPVASVSRIFDSVQGLTEGIAAAKALHLLDITVTSTLVERTDLLPARWRYHLDATELPS